MKKDEKHNDGPTVGIRQVLILIRAHCEGNNDAFKSTSMEIAKQLEQQGESSLELYIKGLFNETPVWVPM